MAQRLWKRESKNRSPSEAASCGCMRSLCHVPTGPPCLRPSRPTVSPLGYPAPPARQGRDSDCAVCRQKQAQRERRRRTFWITSVATLETYAICPLVARCGLRLVRRLYRLCRHVRESQPMPASVPEAIRAHREQMLYLVVGAWNTLFQYVSFSVLYYLLHDHLFSSLILLLSYALSSVNGFLGYRYIVFRSKGRPFSSTWTVPGCLPFLGHHQHDRSSRDARPHDFECLRRPGALRHLPGCRRLSGNKHFTFRSPPGTPDSMGDP